MKYLGWKTRDEALSSILTEFREAPTMEIKTRSSVTIAQTLLLIESHLNNISNTLASLLEEYRYK